ncbi:hypothetical protein GCM10023195_14800 [Actinoallomurus liliacearum]|uniref:CU044_5270 family protein n=1 Tax=Actinoallomurus liliacearum TaxID=1080073 RepID=A0ABP8TGL6_9ACTN
MNDIYEVRRIMAPADPCPLGTFDGAAHDPAGRAAYERITTSAAGRTSPSRRAAFRLVAAGGVAGALIAGVAVVVTSGDGSRDRVAAPVTETQQVLNVAATFALKQPFTAPRLGQWVYTETRYRRSGIPDRGQVIRPGSPLRTKVDRTWIRADGTRRATYDPHGKLLTSATGGGTPPTGYATVAKLPTDPDAMLAWARKEPTPGDRNEGAFQLFEGLLLNNGALPPAQTAAAYRAMAKIPGVTVDRAARDGAGHKAVSVSFLIEGYMKEEILLDPSTYAYRGHRDTVVRDHTMPDGGRFLKGAVESYSVRLAAGVVDRPGQRP